MVQTDARTHIHRSDFEATMSRLLQAGPTKVVKIKIVSL